MSQRSQFSNLETQLRRIGGAYGRELLGGVLALIGGLLLLSVLGYNAGGDAAPPFLIVLAGWTAPLLALAILIAGVVLLLGPRAGYWSAEALVGAELLLLGLQIGAYVAANASVDWRVRLDGTAGGLIGWALGNLLLAAFGRWLALLLAAMMVVAGGALLVRYTPLVFAAARLMVWLPGVGAWGERLVRRNDDGALPHTRTFVAPYEPTDSREGVALRRQPAAFVAPAAPANSPPKQQTKNAGPTQEGQKRAAPPAHGQPPISQPAVSAAPAASAAARPAAKPTGKQAAVPARPTHLLPPVDLLTADSGSYGNADVLELERIILRTLEDFDVPVRVVHVESGPTVTQFGVEPLYTERAGQRRKVRVNRIVGLANDLALALAAPAVRIEAPVPGRAYVGIEVPNPDKSLVSLRGIVESAAMTKGGALVLPLGRNTAGHPVVMDLTKAPHLLIAGATGSGKSVCINTIVTGLLMKHGPESLRFVLVDPKMVELPGYNGIPHLYGKVITDVEHVMAALTWLLLQMDDRYQLFRDAGVRNIEAYNALMSKEARKHPERRPLPFIVLVIDELADLMMTAADDVERQICRLAQMARATGIHLVLATQRPSTDVITGLIKANFPTRISFSVTSQIDSRVVLDTPGAETLLGRGDMLLMRPDVGKLTRLQGCFVADEEISRVVSYWKLQTADAPPQPAPWNSIMDQLGDDQGLIEDAIDVLRNLRTCSTSMLQRKLGLGYPKAARLMDELAKQGIVGPDLGGGRGREVLLKRKEGDSGAEDEPGDDDLFAAN
jgi:S-DNA-T family DNA segregation ATPase FtsK/SpoIIIE